MIRSALLLCVGIVFATCFACTPAATPQRQARPAAGPTCTADQFAAKATGHYLTTAFTPSHGEAWPNGVSLPSGSTYAADLVSAFAIASPTFQQQLCDLDAVYINYVTCSSDTGCDNSWGWRRSTDLDRPRAQQQVQRLVALSTSIWSYKSAAAPYSSYESDLMENVMGLAVAPYYFGAATCSNQGSCNCDSNPGNCTSVDTFPMVVLAALAHEVGHILWYDKVATYQGNGVYGPPQNICSNGKDFFSGWNTPFEQRVNGNFRYLLTPAERLLRWGGPGSQWPSRHKHPPHIKDDIDGGSGPNRPLSVARLLASTQIWASPYPQPWASAFGAVSPDEDFVETYKFKILTTAQPPLKWVKIGIPGRNSTYFVNVVDDYYNNLKPDLADKVSCLPDSFF